MVKIDKILKKTGHCKDAIFCKDACSSSSSSECCDSSSSSCSSESVELDCQDRRKWKCDVCYRSLKAFSVDTCAFRYKRRKIIIPSEKYPTLDCAMQTLQFRSGGYIIE